MKVAKRSFALNPFGRGLQRGKDQGQAGFTLGPIGGLLCGLLWCGLITPLLAEESAQAQVQPQPQVQALEPVPVTVSGEVTEAALQARIKETEASSTLDAAVKQERLSLLQQALLDLKAEQKFAARYADYVAAQEQAPYQIEVLKQALSLESPVQTAQDLGVSATTELAELEKRLAEQQSRRLKLESTLADIESELHKQVGRTASARQRLEEARQQLRQLVDESLEEVEGESASLVQARTQAKELRQRALRAEIKALDQELLSQPVRLDLLRAQRDMNARALNYADKLVEQLRGLTDQQRLAEAQRATAKAQEVQESAQGKHPLLGELAEQNTQLASRIKDRVSEMERSNGLIEEARSLMKRYQDDLQSIQQKLEYAGLSGALGRALFEKRRSLPDLGQLRQRLRQREEVMAEIGLQQISFTDERRHLADLGQALTEMLSPLAPAERLLVETEAQELLASQRELIDRAIAQSSAYMQVLVELDFAERRLLQVLEEFDELLAENLLWIPSSEGLGVKTLSQLPDHLADLFAAEQWQALARASVAGHAYSLPLLFGVLVVAVLLGLAPRLKQQVLASGQHIGNPFKDHIGLSLRALLWLLLRALPWPLLMLLMGLQLRLTQEQGLVALSGAALLTLSPMFLQLRLFWLLCEPDGVAQKHFRWNPIHARLLRKELMLLMLTMLPAGFFTWISGDVQGGVLNHLFLILGLLAIGRFLARILHPGKGLPALRVGMNRQGLLARSRHLWYPALLAIPLAMVALILLGYFYTAGVFVRGLVNSLLLLFALVILRELVLRWLLLRLLQARRAVREREREEARARMEEESSEEAEVLPRVEEPEMDLDAVDTSSRKLLGTAFQLGLIVGLWFIWAPLLPAFNIFNEVELWRYTVSSGQEAREVPVTLASLLLAGLTVLVTLASARNLPNVLEIILLKQMALDAGARYTYTTLTRYLVVGVGVTVFFSLLGGSWSEIQWLVAALGVGIGFGLQEIVANFVSGIIILFERPIRVGDVVTVGEVSGVVSKIRIRATTITNWDRQELLVPNKEFITNQLLNWSLSDQVTRITVPVGVDYGSDVGLALRLIEEAAHEHDNVLADPAPLVTFENFGDNTLNLLARCYLPSVDRLLTTVSELHQSIYVKFNQAGISIAFPQRDVHLDTRSPLEVHIVSDKAD
ncbi:mechanosensitive ion channel [Magnetovirga frankeli]|uniref:mechanosensitive ion channel domain-containing protein n=1 Tax=Magnetovirga frankeli TaxID=947516 RepID=UPI0012935580|nr:mechanosensitive ion channel [gamma proteobacterium SS-5]